MCDPCGNPVKQKQFSILATCSTAAEADGGRARALSQGWLGQLQSRFFNPVDK